MPLPNTPKSYKSNPLPKAYYFSDWSLGLSLKSSEENVLPNLFYSNSFEFKNKSIFSYEIELFVERRFDDNWILVSGLNFRSVSFEFDHIFPITFSKNGNPLADGKFINEYDLTINNSFEEMNFIATAEYTMFEGEGNYQDNEDLNFRVSSVNNIKFLGVPLAIKKEFGYKKLKFAAKVGLEPAIIIKTKIDYERYHQSGFNVEGDRPNYKSNNIGSVEIPRVKVTDLEMISQTNNLKNFQIHGFINVGLLHTFKYHTFFLEAEYKRGLSAFSQINSHTSKSYLINYGFRTGFIKRFKESKVIDMTRPNKILRW